MTGGGAPGYRSENYFLVNSPTLTKMPSFALSMAPKSVPHEQAPALAMLTPREYEVLVWLAEGKSNWAIGQIVGCTEETVKKHLQRVYRKLGVESRVSAAVFFARLSGPDRVGPG